MFEEFLPLQHCAAICHEANKVLCELAGDNSQPSWEDAPNWQKESAVNGVKAIRDGVVKAPEDSHVSWSKEKIENGWVYGDVKDVDLKTHPCLVPYSQLPESQKIKDRMFFNIVLQFFASHPELSEEAPNS